MIIIYSDKEVKGIGGAYISPRFFDENNLEKGVEVVYTSDKKIAEAYNAIGVTAKGFPRNKTTETDTKD